MYFLKEYLYKLILQPFRHFAYVTAHSPILPSLYLRQSSYSNPSFDSPTSQLILQTIFRFSYVTGSSLTSPGEPPMIRTNKELMDIYQDKDLVTLIKRQRMRCPGHVNRMQSNKASEKGYGKKAGRKKEQRETTYKMAGRC